MDSEPLHFIILGLATWRLASLLTRESGPLAIFDKIRHWAGVRYNEHSEMVGTNEVSKGMLCMWCLSIWTGTFWAVIYLFSGVVAVWLALPFALAAVAIMTEELVNR